MNKTIIGIDNGTSGSIGLINDETVVFVPTPSKTEQDYTKKKKNISRLDVEKFKSFLEEYINKEPLCILERPLVNPKMFRATEGALRCFEAELSIIESLKISHIFLDSKEWQRKILPSGIKGSKELKKASLDIGLRLFPQFEKEIKKQKDADGLLIAYYYYHYF